MAEKVEPLFPYQGQTLYPRAAVNLGGTINVYSSCGHGTYPSVVGTIATNQAFIVAGYGCTEIDPYPSGSSLSWPVWFVKNGAFAEGWINRNTSCVGYRFRNSNGSGLVGISTVTINGVQHSLMATKRSVAVLNSSGTSWGSLAANVYIATRDDCTGVSNTGYMRAHYYRPIQGSGAFQTFGSNTYAFVNLDLKNGSMPNNRAVW